MLVCRAMLPKLGGCDCSLFIYLCTDLTYMWSLTRDEDLCRGQPGPFKVYAQSQQRLQVEKTEREFKCTKEGSFWREEHWPPAGVSSRCPPCPCPGEQQADLLCKPKAMMCLLPGDCSLPTGHLVLAYFSGSISPLFPRAPYFPECCFDKETVMWCDQLKADPAQQ